LKGVKQKGGQMKREKCKLLVASINESSCGFPTLTHKFLGVSKVNASKIKHLKFPEVMGTVALLSKLQQYIN
jgi:hypothetical protein